MWFFRKTAEFFCAKCYATGRLPVVDGDASCPQCGEQVWTVRADRQPIDRTKPITPDYRLPIYVTPPAIRMRGRRLAMFCVRLFPSYVGYWLAGREKRANAHISALLQKLQLCQSRVEFEAVLGKPVYAVSGKGWWGTIRRDGRIRNEPAEVIERYDCGVCSMDLSFKDDRLQDMCGYTRPTRLDIEFHQHEDSH